jgi:hypothetical protein
MQILKWFQSNQTTRNAGKTSLVIFAPTKLSLNPLNLYHDGQIIVDLNNTKLLVFQLDSQHIWKEHINCLLNKLTVVCLMMRKLVYVKYRHTKGCTLCTFSFP